MEPKDRHLLLNLANILQGKVELACYRHMPDIAKGDRDIYLTVKEAKVMIRNLRRISNAGADASTNES